MQKKQIDVIRDAALLLEAEHLDKAMALMEIAKEYRPDGPFICNKLDEYRSKYRSFETLWSMHSSGDLVIIPAGFRYYIKQLLSKKLGIEQPSLPFDSGFFSPLSISRVLENREIDLRFSSLGHPSHDVCYKQENASFNGGAKGISFKRMGYASINAAVSDRNQNDINKYLDNTMGYYTVDNNNKFVLAHYNWHSFADENQTSGITEPSINIPKINELINRRISRMFDLCQQAKIIVFCYAPYRNYTLMKIDDEEYSLTDLSLLKRALGSTFKSKKVALFELEQMDTPDKLFKNLSL